MDRVILLAIAAVVISLLVGQVLKGGLGLLRIISIALVFGIVVLLSARPSGSPGLLPSLAQRLWSANNVRINAEASGEVLTDDGTSSSFGNGSSTPFTAQSDLSANAIPRSPEAAFSGATTTASSNDIESQTPTSTFSTQATSPTSATSNLSPSTSSPSVPSAPVDTAQSGTIPPSTASSQVQQPSSTGYTPPPSTSRPINALW